MVISNLTYNPYILTIPDDATVFSVVNSNSPMFSKIIMENYINFFALRTDAIGYVILRFENFFDYECIEGIDHAYIPIEIFKELVSDKKYWRFILGKGYIVNIPVLKRYVDFYKNNSLESHRMMIYGIDLDQDEFFCKDFKNNRFVDFKTSVQSIIDSTKAYFDPNCREPNGLHAFRIDETVAPTIDYARSYQEFSKLRLGVYSGSTGYGVGAIDLFLKNIQLAEPTQLTFFRWYEAANFFRESCKLFIYRYQILSKNGGVSEELLVRIRQLNKYSDKLFFLVRKQFATKRFDRDTLEKIISMGKDCRSSFYNVATEFCNQIQYLIK